MERGENDIEVFLKRDISLSDPSLLDEHHRFSGTFHGNGHTIWFNHGVPKGWRIALFQRVQYATIENLTVKARIRASSYKLSGLVYDAAGRTTISNCVIDADIQCSYDGGASEISGMVTEVLPNANVMINDCVVKGKFNATTNAGQSGMSGFVHTMKGSCTLNNCLYLGENNAIAGNTFAPNGTNINNCYYLNACGAPQGEQITTEQLKNGAVAWMLQGGATDMAWGQVLGTDTLPRLSDEAAKRVRRVAFVYNDQVAVARYVNTSGKVKLPTVRELLGTAFDTSKTYKLEFKDNFSEDTPVVGDLNVKGKKFVVR